MKLSRSILIILPALMLASCGGGDPKQPVGPTTSASSPSTSSSVVNPYVRHLTLEEVVSTFQEASRTLNKITNVSVKDSYVEATLNGETGAYDKKEYVLNEVSALFTNSVIFTSFTAANPDKEDEYKMFGKYDTVHEPSYGAQVEQYIAFSDTFDKINTINVYKQVGQANKKNEVIPVDATLTNAETKFKMLDAKFALIDPQSEKDNLTTFALDTKGYYEIIHTVKSENTIGDAKTIDTHTKAYKFQNGQLFYETITDKTENIQVSTDKRVSEMTTSYSAEFSYSTNGEFDRSKLPGAN